MTTIETRLLTMQRECSAVLARALIENDALDLGELADRGLLVGDTAAAAHRFQILSELLDGLQGLGGPDMLPEHRERLNIVVMSKVLLAVDAGNDAGFDRITTTFDPGMSFATRALIRTMAAELIGQLELQPNEWRWSAETAVLEQQLALDNERERLEAEEREDDEEDEGPQEEEPEEEDEEPEEEAS